jgi:PQQ-dependent dehydrogenase (s-GDH family)
MMRKTILSILAAALFGLPALINAQSCTGTTGINFQRWNNISGSAVSNLTSNPNYPNNPSSSGTRSLFEMQTNQGNNFGIKMYGYICPPSTGTYYFWIASDASAELWLSTTSSPANKIRIAFNTSSTNSRQWNKYASQKSAAIILTAGQLYYAEALMKESTGSDNLAAGWAKPGQSSSSPSEVIPGASLRLQLPDTQAPSAPANLSASNITQTSLTLNWTASNDNVAVTGYDVYRNGIKINAATVTGTTYNVTGLTAGTAYTFYTVAKDAAGNQSAASSPLNVSTVSPDTEAPSVPANVSSSVISQTSIRLNWAASTDNVAVTGYDVYRNGIKANTSTITATTYNITGLTAGTTYALTVVAKDAAGNQSAANSPLNVSTLLPTPLLESFTMRTIIPNQRMPHDLVYGPDDNIWYIERFAGTVSFVNPVTSVKRVVLTLGSNMARTGGQDGLFGLALHPQFNEGKPYVYIAYTYQSLSFTVRKTRIERYTYNFGSQLLEQPVTVIENLPGSNDHNSGRIAIGPDLKLYYTIGDMGAGQFDNASRTQNAQNINVYEGKTLRLNTEIESGSWIPADNPFTNAGSPTAVYTLGHRNPQGLVWGNVNGTDILYSGEHGPYSDDEINIIENSRNYGWPWVAGFCDGNYNGRTNGGFAVVSEQNNCVTLNAKEPVFSMFPVSNPPNDATSFFSWPTVAPSGMDFYGNTAIPGWQHSLLMANLKKGTVTRYKLSTDGLRVVSDTIHYFLGLGRFRDVIVSPDGLKLYVACDSSGSTSGPTGNVTTTPANPGSILEFTYSPPPQMARQPGSAEGPLNNKSLLRVYPNPANRYFIITNFSTEGKKIVELSDITGKLIKRQTLNNVSTRIETSNLANGIYLLKVFDAQNNIIKTEKLIIQN